MDANFTNKKVVKEEGRGVSLTISSNTYSHFKLLFALAFLIHLF